MTTHRPSGLPDDVPSIRLTSEALWVDVLPANGGDIYTLVDRRTGIDLLWKAPWGTGLRPGDDASTRDRWIASTWGGWQVLLPNTGDEALESGRVWGFHGEAGIRAWTVEARAAAEVELSLELESAPLAVRRTCRVDHATLSVATTVTNRSAEPVEFLWGEHPTFGEDIASGATLEIDAATIVIDVATGAGVQAGDRLAWPGPADADGSLARIPGRGSRRLLLAYLDGMQRGSYRLRNDARGLAVRVQWPIDVFPCVWLWEELTASDVQPWNGEAYGVGIEPQAAYPAVGMAELRRRGGQGVRLAAGASIGATVAVTVEHVT